jgi:hypothetical protein
MKIRSPLRVAAVAPVALAGTLVACGSSGSTPTTGAAGTPSATTPSITPSTPTASLSILTCPSVSTVNAGLGVSVADPSSVAPDGLPAGSTGVTCTYSGGAAGDVVVIVLVSGPVATSFVSRVEAGEQSTAQQKGDTYAATNVSGVGSQAAIVTLSEAGSPTENGILAATGNAGLSVTVIPPESASQLQSFASQLLG